MAVDLDAVEGADIDVLGIGWARMHADLAAEHDAGIGFADQPQGIALTRVFAKAITDRCRAAAKGQKPPGAGDLLAIGERIGDLLRCSVAFFNGTAATE